MTSINNKARERFADAHRKLDEINDLRKENEERKVLQKLPTKPIGIDSIGILNMNLRHVSKQSVNFNITSVAEFENAFNEARNLKTKSVTVNNRTYKIKQIGNNFWYGAIVGNGGIAVYLKRNYLLVITHNQKMSLNAFASYFEHMKHSFENHKDQLRTIYVKDHSQLREDVLKKRLRNDKHLYDNERDSR